MKPRGRDSGPRMAPQRGGATLIMLTVLAIMVVLLVANSIALYHLKRDLQLIEEKQLRKAEEQSGDGTDRSSSAHRSGK